MSFASRLGPPWKDVPKDEERTWFAAEEDVWRHGHQRAVSCPFEDGGRVRYFFVPSNNAGGGSSWTWCTACHRQVHGKALQPAWWVPNRKMAERDLRLSVDWLNEHWEQIKPENWA